MFRCRHGVCSRGVECMSECETYVEPDPEDLLALREPVPLSGEEMDRIADEYFDARERMLERNRP